MDKRILFNIASRSRPAKFENLLENIKENIAGSMFMIRLKVDTDDIAFRAYENIARKNNSIISFCPGVSKNKIDAINRDIPRYGESWGKWDIIVDISDDFIITRKGFDNIIREHCGPDDCLHFPEPYATKQNENNRNANIIIMAVMGREYYNRFGYIFCPEYKSVWCDNELTDVAKITGRYKFVDEDIFYHAHPTAGYGPKDAQTKHTESFWNADKRTYNKRKEMNFGL